MAKLITKQVDSVQAASGKWCAAFENWRVLSETDSYMASSVLSGAVFDDKDAAQEAGKRALQTLEETGKYPNMCEPW